MRILARLFTENYMSTIEVKDKTPIFLFRQDCVDCTHLNAAGKRTLKCHYATPNSQGRVNDDCPAAEHYMVIGFNPERVSTAYVKATSAGDNRRIIAIVQAVNNQHENVQQQFWSMVQYKTALQIGAVAFDAEVEADEENGAPVEYDPVESQQQVGTHPQHAAQNAQQGQGFRIDIPPTPAVPAPDVYESGQGGAVDTNEWNEE